MLNAGMLQPASKRQDQSLTRPLVIDSPIERAPLAVVLGLDVEMLGDDGTALEMGCQSGDFLRNAGQLVHPLVALMDGVRMVGGLSQFAIQLWIIVNCPFQRLAGLAVPLQDCGADPIGVQI